MIPNCAALKNESSFRRMTGPLRAAMTVLNQRCQLGVRNLRQRELRCDEEAVSMTSTATARIFSPIKMTAFQSMLQTNFAENDFQNVFRLTMPTSRLSRPSTTASLWPPRCMRRNATSNRRSASRNKAGFT